MNNLCVGNIYSILDDKVILAHVTSGKFALINLSTGNRWAEPIEPGKRACQLLLSKQGMFSNDPEFKEILKGLASGYELNPS